MQSHMREAISTLSSARASLSRVPFIIRMLMDRSQSRRENSFRSAISSALIFPPYRLKIPRMLFRMSSHCFAVKGGGLDCAVTNCGAESPTRIDSATMIALATLLLKLLQRRACRGKIAISWR
jgi:hypothetical protein